MKKTLESSLSKQMKGGKSEMDKSVMITLIIVAGFVVVAGIGYAVFSALAPSTSNTVTGNGEASMDVTPDLVKVYFNVETNGSTSKEANDKNSEIVDNLISSLLMEGFERNDIQTQNFNVYEDFTWTDKGDRKSIGFKATHTIIVEISTLKTDKIGDVIDAGINAGAGVSYINFELSPEKQNEYKAQVLKLASEDAKMKAESIAEGLGKELGSLVSVEDNNFYYSPWGVYSARGESVSSDNAMAKEATANIVPSEQTISASIRAVFKLK